MKTVVLAVVLGTASWFHSTPGHAAAGPILRQPGWRGSQVLVCAAPIRLFRVRCVFVKLSDWCQCYRNTTTERVIDLDRSDFARLAPPSRGLVKIVVFGG